MNILIFASRIIYGGGEKVINWLSHKLIEDGHNVIYASPRIDSEYIEKLKLVGLYSQVTLVEYPHNIKKSRIINYCKSLKKIYDDYNVNLIIIFGGSLVEQLIARKKGIKILLSERCNPKSRSLVSRALKRLQYMVADAYVFQTMEACNYYGKKLIKKSAIVPNPIIDNLETPEFKKLRKEIVSVGRLSAEKNQMMLLNAFYKSNLHQKGYRLLLYGTGPAERELETFIKRYELASNVSIIKGETNIARLVKGASLFVLTSNDEGMPNALIEAMSMGLLSISTDCPIYGPRLLIRHGVNGFLTPVGDVDSLSRLMVSALSHPNADSIRQEAYKIREQLSSERIFNYWKTLIEGFNY